MIGIHDYDWVKKLCDQTTREKMVWIFKLVLRCRQAHMSYNECTFTIQWIFPQYTRLLCLEEFINQDVLKSIIIWLFFLERNHLRIHSMGHRTHVGVQTIKDYRMKRIPEDLTRGYFKPKCWWISCIVRSHLHFLPLFLNYGPIEYECF